MKKEFYQGNRNKLYESFSNNSIAVFFAGKAPRKTADENYPFFASRNFVYLTGLQSEGFILLVEKTNNTVKETIFILPPDLMIERWSGRRLKSDEVTEISGIENIKYLDQFNAYLHRLISYGHFESIYLDLFKNTYDESDDESYKFVDSVKKVYPGLVIKNAYNQLRKQRTIKQPCEIEAIRKALTITKEGIEAMMKASKPNMYEYEYKAVFDYMLTKNGVLSSAFPSIISGGKNNFCIHYYEYTGLIKDGDMVLNDVGACYDNLCNDVSRGWPCNGKFTEKQKLLYQCAYNTSEYMFSIIKPGMLMSDVDKVAREYNYEQLKKIGLCETFEDISKYMWHGGAHHVGFDVHDVVDASGKIEAGMVFCVDIGIYNEDWGIGFRIEDNCLVTENGCENLSKDIPRTIEEIESFMAKK